jgi:hypothetical protein
MTKGTDITTKHFSFAMWLITGLVSAIISLGVYIWQDSKEDNRRLNDSLQKTINELKESQQANDRDIAEIKKYILLRDSIDIDKRVWENQSKKYKSNPRGATHYLIENMSKNISFAGNP